VPWLVIVAALILCLGHIVPGVLNNGLDRINIDSFLKILLRVLILLAALIINVYAQRMRAESPKG
jgi:ribose transport system permease protein